MRIPPLACIVGSTINLINSTHSYMRGGGIRIYSVPEIPNNYPRLIIVPIKHL